MASEYHHPECPRCKGEGFYLRRDDFEVPLTTTMGELRAFATTLAAYHEAQP